MSDNVANPTSPVSPVAPYPPIPDVEHRSRAPEFYGFVALTSTSLLFLIYLLWALLPNEYIVWVGVDWYPSREWALLLPAYSVVIVLLTYFVYFALAIRSTPSFSEMSTITDSKAHFPPLRDDGQNAYVPKTRFDTTPELFDIPLGMVNRVVYSRMHTPAAGQHGKS